MNWEIAAAFIPLVLAVFGLVFHAGAQNERLKQLRKEHDQLTQYAHRISHETIERVSVEVDRIKRYLIRHVPNGVDEL